MKNISLPLLVFSFVCLVISACKKETKVRNAVPSAAEQTFFQRPAQLDSFVERVIDTIDAQNLKAPFIEELAKEIGQPFWERSEVVRPTSLINPSC